MHTIVHNSLQILPMTSYFDNNSPSKFQLSRHFEIGNNDLLPAHLWMSSIVYDTHSFSWHVLMNTVVSGESMA
jgi:hypothetical protein